MRAIEETYERELICMKQSNQKMKEIALEKGGSPITMVPERIHSCNERTRRKGNSKKEEFLGELSRVLRNLEDKIALIRSETA